MRRLSLFSALLLSLALTACGFHLRGTYNLPFKTLYIGMAPSTELYASIKRTVEAGSSVEVLDSPKEADARLNVNGNTQEKRILSTNSAGQAREYELVRIFAFQLVDKNNRALLPPSQITLKREVTYSDSVVLSKEAEEQLLWRDIQNDMVQQLMRRLAAARVRED